ncbi:MAG: FAD-binding protein [Pseudoflavonifractor sp.]
MKKNAFAALVLTGAMSLTLLSGCSTKTTTPTVAPVAPAPTPAASTIATDYGDTKTADVVIIGAGAGGMSAALEAVAQGAGSVLLLEKTERTGGSLNFTSGSMSAAETTIQKEDGIADTKESFVQDIIKNGSKYDGKVDESLVRAFVEEDTAAFEWLYEAGLKDMTPATDTEGRRAVFAPEHDLYSVQRTYKYRSTDKAYKSVAHMLMDNMLKAEPKITVEYTTTAVELAPNDQGQVLTVIGSHADGSATRYDAAKGVIVATGGYSANKALMGHYAKNGQFYLAGGPSTADGSGLLLLQHVGGAIREDSMGACPIFPMGLESRDLPGTGTIASTYTWKAGGIVVNKDGVRFMNETNPDNATREMALIDQPEAVQYDIYTDKIVEDLRAAKGSGMFDMMFGKEDSMGRHAVVEAASLDELAQKAGINAEGLKKTVEAYNQSVASGAPDSFGRTFDATLSPFKVAVNKIEGEKFYAVPLHSLCVMTMGGIHANADMQVLDQSGNAIPGLFAAGEVVGGIWGNFVSGGTGVMGPIAFGRIAARTVMNGTLATGYTVSPATNPLDPALFTKAAGPAGPSFDMTRTLKDGSYEATVDGQEGPMTVKVTVAGGKLSAVEITAHQETEAVAAAALKGLPSAIVAANSVDVDSVAGATLSSGRIKSAVVACLEQAAA